jgi:hypothetical protein
MKADRSVILLPGLAGLVAASCNSNNCLRGKHGSQVLEDRKRAVIDTPITAIIGSAVPTRSGAADCSSYLAVTVTPATSTVTSTVTIRPTVLTTSVDTRYYTTSETTTVSTETDTTIVQETQTASTETDFVTITVSDPAELKARQATQTSSTYPAYASPCSAWDRYVSACSCVGVFPTTITVATPITITVVTETTVSLPTS